MKVSIQAIRKDGRKVRAKISVSEQFGMWEFVNAVKERGYTHFRIVDTMKVFAEVPR